MEQQNNYMKGFAQHLCSGGFDRWILKLVEIAETAALSRMMGNKANPEYYLTLGEAASSLLTLAQGLTAVRTVKAAYRLPDNGGKFLMEEFKLFYESLDQLEEADKIKEILGKDFKEIFIDKTKK